MRSLSFELSLLSRMPAEYQAYVLREIGLSEQAVVAATNSFPWPQLYHVLQDLKSYDRLFESEGPKIRRRSVEDYVSLFGPEGSEPRTDSQIQANLQHGVDHCFLPMLWPHLYWVVTVGADGIHRECGFQNQAEIAFQNFDPSAVRVGVWTLKALERLARSSELFDGFGEHKVVRFDFESSQFVGEFIFGLLVKWNRA